MNMVLFLREDCAYRADRVDTWLTVLWHPHEKRLVGIKLKDFHFLFEQARTILSLGDSDSLPLIKVLEIALIGGITESMLDGTSEDYIQQLYADARKLVGDAELPPKEWRRSLDH
jgi:hypothetical protein